MTEQQTPSTEAELSPGTIRARRSRAHAKGDHSLCLPTKCPYAAPDQENDMPEPTAPAEETSDKLIVGIPDLVVYPDGDPSYAERENPAPAPDPDTLLAILGRLGGSGISSLEDRKIRAVTKAISEFDATVPAEVELAAQAHELARRRQAAIRNAKPRRFEADDLLADDWEDRLDRALSAANRSDSNTWEPVVGAAVTQTAANLRGAVARSLPAVVAQVERWLVANQKRLARYSVSRGNITSNELLIWQGWASAIWDFARLTADSGGGGQVHDVPGSVSAWTLLWDWTPEQWRELNDHTNPGRELHRGDTTFGVALAIGAKVSFPLSVRELKDRYNRLYDTTLVGSKEASLRQAQALGLR